MHNNMCMHTCMSRACACAYACTLTCACACACTSASVSLTYQGRCVFPHAPASEWRGVACTRLQPQVDDRTAELLLGDCAWGIGLGLGLGMRWGRGRWGEAVSGRMGRGRFVGRFGFGWGEAAVAVFVPLSEEIDDAHGIVYQRASQLQAHACMYAHVQGYGRARMHV